MDNIKAYVNAAPPNDINKLDAIAEMCNQVKGKTNATKFLVICNELEFASLKALAPVCAIAKNFVSFSYEPMISKMFMCQLGENEVTFFNSDLPGTSDLIYVIPLIEEPKYDEETSEETDESSTEDNR